jgi:hypothetical protein
MQMEQRTIQESWINLHQRGVNAKAIGLKAGCCWSDWSMAGIERESPTVNHVSLAAPGELVQ